MSRKNKGVSGENFVHSTAVSNVEIYKKVSSSNDTGLLTRAEEKDTFADKKLADFLSSVNEDNTPSEGAVFKRLGCFFERRRFG